MACPFPGLPSPANDPEFAHGRRPCRETTTHFGMPHANVRVSGKLQVNEGIHLTVSTSATLLPAVVRPTADALHWLSADHGAGPVLDLLDALGWAIVDTPEANVHATSPDGCVYVGWLPEDPSAWQRNIVWHIRVQPADGDAWVQEFGLHTPSEAVAGFLAALVTNSSC